MQSVSTTINPKLSLYLFFLLVGFTATAQENSPFSRYGLGDRYPSQNVINRAMGSIGSTYAHGQSINLGNPAAYSELRIVTYDIGVTVDNRTLKSASPVDKYNSVNLSPSYVALGLPLSKKRNLGLAFGLRPLTRISYSIEQNKRVGLDSVNYLYEGDGGLYQAFIGVGKRWGGLRIGFNTGYLFGNKSNGVITTIVDSIYAYRSNSQTLTTFNRLFFNAGLQYDAKLGKNSLLRFGVAGNLKQQLNGQQQITRETFIYDATGGREKIDSVFSSPEVRGTIHLPVSYSAGLNLLSTISDNLGNKFEKSSIAVEYETAKWANYRFYDKPDQFVNSWMVKVGGQLTPNPLSIRSYWNRVAYRAGFFYGKDAVNADGKSLPVFAVTFGAGFPVRKWRSLDNQYTIINTTFEIGKRGNKENNISEGFFRISLGLNLSDVWFIKRKYD